MEQAKLIKKLLKRQLGFDEKSLNILEAVMHHKTTAIGSMYGKTGSGQNVDDIQGNDTNPVSNLGHHAAYLTLSYEKNDWTNSLLLSS